MSILKKNFTFYEEIFHLFPALAFCPCSFFCSMGSEDNALWRSNLFERKHLMTLPMIWWKGKIGLVFLGIGQKCIFLTEMQDIKFPDNELIASGWVAIILKGFILLRGWKALWGVCMQTKTRGIWSHLEKGGAAVLAESLENIYIPAPFISYSCCTEEDINRTNYKNMVSIPTPKSYCINVHRSLAKS